MEGLTNSEVIFCKPVSGRRRHVLPFSNAPVVLGKPVTCRQLAQNGGEVVADNLLEILVLLDDEGYM